MSQLYDLTKLEEIGRGNETFIKKMIALFIEQGPGSVTEIKNAFAAGDLEKVKAVAHRIKPSIDNMGIHSLVREIREIESLAPGQENSRELNSLIEHLESTMNQVVSELKKR